MGKYIIYFLPIVALYQVLYGSGSKWLACELSDLEEAAESGDAYAMGYLSLCHLHGDKGLTISLSEARFHAEQSARRGHWSGEFSLGCLSRLKPLGPDGAMVAKRFLNAFRDPDGQLVREAAFGDPFAMYALAEIFSCDELKSVIECDLKLAARYYETSAAAGYGPSKVQSALILLNGMLGSSADEEAQRKQGVSLLSSAIEQKLPAAHHYLARCYWEGNGIEQDAAMALVHFQAAAEGGFTPSLLIAADFHAYGLAGPSNRKLAMEYAFRAVEMGVDEARLKISEYENLDDETSSPKVVVADATTPKPVDADPLLSDSSTPGNNRPIKEEDLLSSIRLPPAYAHSEEKEAKPAGLADVPFEASLQTKVASNDSSAPSVDETREHAKRLYWSEETKANLDDARKLFLLASNLGDAESARYLGLIHLKGKGVEKDVGQAMKWLQLAADRGDALAAKNLHSLKRIMGE